MNKPIITAAPNLTGKSSEEIFLVAQKFADHGATMFRLDAHKGEEKRAIDLIRIKLGDRMVVQITGESGGVYSPEQQMKLIMDLQPEAVLIPLTEFMPRPDYEIEAEEFFTWVKEHKIIAQYALHSVDELKYFIDLADQRIIPEGDNFVLFAPTREAGNIAPFIKVMKETDIKFNWVAALSNATNAVNIIKEGGGVELSDIETIEKITRDEAVVPARLKEFKKLF